MKVLVLVVSLLVVLFVLNVECGNRRRLRLGLPKRQRKKGGKKNSKSPPPVVIVGPGPGSGPTQPPPVDKGPIGGPVPTPKSPNPGNGNNNKPGEGKPPTCSINCNKRPGLFKKDKKFCDGDDECCKGDDGVGCKIVKEVDDFDALKKGDINTRHPKKEKDKELRKKAPRPVVTSSSRKKRDIEDLNFNWWNCDFPCHNCTRTCRRRIPLIDGWYDQEYHQYVWPVYCVYTEGYQLIDQIACLPQDCQYNSRMEWTFQTFLVTTTPPPSAEGHCDDADIDTYFAHPKVYTHCNCDETGPYLKF